MFQSLVTKSDLPVCPSTGAGSVRRAPGPGVPSAREAVLQWPQGAAGPAAGRAGAGAPPPGTPGTGGGSPGHKKGRVISAG